MTKTKSTSAQAAGRAAMRVIFPFRAMRQTVVLARKEMDRTRESFVLLRELGIDARKTLSDGLRPKGSGTSQNFQEALDKRSEGALSEDALYRFFLRKKRLTLGTAALFAAMGLYSVIGGILLHQGRGVALGAASLLASQPFFFVMALGSQLRLWQLKTRRLSKEEKGGLNDFMREVRGWWWDTLDPEFGHNKKVR